MYGNNNDGWEEDKNENLPATPQLSDKHKKGIKIAGIVAAALLIIFLLTRCFGGGGKDEPDKIQGEDDIPVNASDTIPDGNNSDDIQSGTITPSGEDNSSDLQTEVNETVEDGMFNVFINTAIYLDNGTSKANLLIQNSKNNKRPAIVEIYRKDNDEMIYQSAVIPAGSKIEKAALNTVLSKGTYPCVAYFNVLDSETEELINRVGVNVQIEVNA